jgi:outer membrane protein TolC
VLKKQSDLLSLYNEALRHDALLSAATLQNQATQELIDQGLSLLLPNISASGSYSDLDNSRNLILQSVMSYWLERKQIIKTMNMGL